MKRRKVNEVHVSGYKLRKPHIDAFCLTKEDFVEIKNRKMLALIINLTQLRAI